MFNSGADILGPVLGAEVACATGNSICGMEDGEVQPARRNPKARQYIATGLFQGRRVAVGITRR
jgi:hypothetical protein